jgi:hypothetical protein
MGKNRQLKMEKYIIDMEEELKKYNMLNLKTLSTKELNKITLNG